MGLKEEAQKVIDGLLEQGKIQLELAVEKEINDKCDEVVEKILQKIADAIPGGLDNVVIEAAKPKVKEELKKLLLSQAEKISDKV